MSEDRSMLSSRLRDIIQGTRRTGQPPIGAWRDPDLQAIASTLGGHVIDVLVGPCILIEYRHAAGSIHGNARVGELAASLEAAADQLSMLLGKTSDGEARAAHRQAGSPALFLDLETTGLSGGAGTYAFLVGCGFFDGGDFCTKQFLLPGFTAERALLAAVSPLAALTGSIITFNGKTFDLPIVETRYAFHRLACPWLELPHVDVLHLARRLWRKVPAGDGEHAARWGTTGNLSTMEATGCTLGALEGRLLGVRRTNDVGGAEIPGRYFHYVRSGDPRPLEPVLEHNRLDLLSLAALTSRAVRLVGEGAAAAENGRECVALGRLYERAGRVHQAVECYERAASLPDNGSEARAAALWHLAVQQRRQRRFVEAASAWERLISLRNCPPALERSAVRALAIHHEHRTKDPSTAKQFALRLHDRLAADDRGAALHRLARLERKLARAGSEPLMPAG